MPRQAISRCGSPGSPGDDDYTGNVTGGLWKIAYSSETSATADTAANAVDVSTDWVQGSRHTSIITGLQPRATYYFWIRARDAGSNWSVWSDTAIAVAGSFVDDAMSFTGVDRCSAAWGDYDNDGDLDLAVSGYNGSAPVTTIYRNTNGTFADSGVSLPGIGWSGLAWGDYDNDGRLDLLVSGSDGTSAVTRVYRNTGGAFVDIQAGIQGMYKPRVAWGDYDNDGDLDVMLSGSVSVSYLTSVYRNDGGVFTGVLSIYDSTPSAVWGDYDGDGDLDLVHVGSNKASIFRNDNGVFSEVAAGLDKAGNGDVAWCDYDNDGDLDLVLSGYGSSIITRVFRNNGGDAFTSVVDLAGVRYSSLAWGDYDHDGDLDLAVAGYTGTASVTTVYRSLKADASNTNTAPQAPASGFDASYDYAGRRLLLRWGYGSDDETTEPKGLYYDVRVATETVTEGLRTWLVSPSTGAGRSPFLGNYPHGFCVASSTQPGLNLNTPLQDTTFYWQVRTLDTGLRSSAWSAEQSFYVSPPIVPTAVTNLAVSTDLQLRLTWTAPGNGAGVACGSYLVKYSTTADIVTEADFLQAATYYQSWTPLAPGATEAHLLTGLIPRTTYWFSVKGSSIAAGGTEWSAVSSTGTNGAASGSFGDSGAVFAGVSCAAAAWGDYDNDGDLDLALAGTTGAQNFTHVYRNTGGDFASAQELTGVSFTSLAWGDYDNDGDLDLALGAGMADASLIYRNTGGGFALSQGLTGVALAWGDYDNDGDLDLVAAGAAASPIIYRSFESDFGNTNAPPAEPSSGFSSSYVAASSRIELRWGLGSDPETPQTGDEEKGLSYEIRIATRSVTDNPDAWIVSPSTGAGCTPFLGNYPHGFVVASSTQPGFNLNTVLRGTTFYWQARTIDTGLRSSAWSAEQLLYVPGVNQPETPSGLTQLTGPGKDAGLAWSGWTNDPSLRLGFTLTDPDEEEFLRYHIQISTPEGFFSAPYLVVDATCPYSGWLNEGTTWYDCSLTLETSCYWRVKSIDNDGLESGYASSAIAAGQFHFGLDMTAPAALTTLSGMAATDRSITLSWTAPGDDGWDGDITNGAYRIRYATCTATGDAFWSSDSAAWDAPGIRYQLQWSTNAAALSAQTATIGGLLDDTTYYVRCWTRDTVAGTSDWDGNWSVLSNAVTFWTLNDCTAPGSITDLTASPGTGEGSITLSWTAPREDGAGGGECSGYLIKHATFSVASLGGDATAWWEHPAALAVPDEGIPGAPGTGETRPVTSLAPGVVYFFSLRSVDDAANQSDLDGLSYAFQASTSAADIVPDIPSGLTVVSCSTSAVVLAWNDMRTERGYLDFDRYVLYRSTDGLTYSAVVSTAGPVCADTAPVPGATSYYRLAARDLPPLELESGMSSFVQAFVPAPVTDYVIPRAPAGVRLTIVDGRPSLAWRRTSGNEDDSPYADPGGYRIYRSLNLLSGWEQAGYAADTGGESYAWTDETPGAFNGPVRYYAVRTVDASGNESGDSMIIDTSPDFNLIAVSPGERAVLYIPAETADILYKDVRYDDDIIVTVEDDAVPAMTGALAQYRFEAGKASSREVCRGFAFAAAARLWFRVDTGGDAPSSRTIPAEPMDTSVFWFNGNQWIKVSSVMEGDTLSLRSKRLGRYLLKESVRASRFTLNSVYPRIFTPDGDNRNDHVEFSFENPIDGNVYGRVYDLRGALVGDLRKGEIGNTLVWDGRGRGGHIALPGVYIYQIETTGAERSTLNGIVILAK